MSKLFKKIKTIKIESHFLEEGGIIQVIVPCELHPYYSLKYGNIPAIDNQSVEEACTNAIKFLKRAASHNKGHQTRLHRELAGIQKKSDLQNKLIAEMERFLYRN